MTEDTTRIEAGPDVSAQPPASPAPAQDTAAASRLSFSRASAQELLRNLFDFQMREIVTTRMVPLIYAAAVGGAGILMLLLVVQGFFRSFGQGLITLLFALPLFLVLVTVIRVSLECVMAIFRILVHLEVVTERTRTIVGHTEVVNEAIADLPRIQFWKFGRRKESS